MCNRSAFNIDLTIDPELPKTAKRPDPQPERIMMKTPHGRKHFYFSRQVSPIFGGLNEPTNKPLKKEWRPSEILVEYNNRKHCIGAQRMRKGLPFNGDNYQIHENKEPLESIKKLIKSKQAIELKANKYQDISTEHKDINIGRSKTPNIRDISNAKLSQYNMNRMNGYMSRIILF